MFLSNALKLKRRIYFILFSFLILMTFNSCNMGDESKDDSVTVPVTSVSILQTNLELPLDGTVQLITNIIPANSSNLAVTWSSNMEEVAIVSNDGLVSAIGEGTATITVTTLDGGFTASCVIVVSNTTEEEPTAVTGVSLNENNLDLLVDDTFQLTASILPVDADDKSVTWSSSNTEIAQVSDNGLVTAVAKGWTTIYVMTSDGYFMDSCIVNITEFIDLSSVTLTPDTLDLNLNETFQFSAEILPSNASNKNLTWSSDNTEIASVDEAGLVTAISEGSTKIRVTSDDGSFQDFCDLSVLDYNKLFISTWDMSKTSSTNTLVLPLQSDGNYNFTINWGDGVIESYTDYDVSHTYSASGVYIVKIDGVCEGFGFTSAAEDNRKNLISIDYWGQMKFHNEGYQFAQCSNLTTFPETGNPNLEGITNFSHMFYLTNRLEGCFFSNWDTSGVTDMSGMFKYNEPLSVDITDLDTSGVIDMREMFYRSRKFNQDISEWNTSNVEIMSGVFYEAEDFNQPLNNWDTSKVQFMSNLFCLAESFNQDLSDWDTSNVIAMTNMFSYALSFNGNISTWNTINVSSMEAMFSGAELFNGDISSWNTSNVENMSRMFGSTDSFNQDISSWITSNVKDMSEMFGTAIVFNQDISIWDTSKVTNMSAMFLNAYNFNQDLSNWDTAKVTNMSRMFYHADSFNGDISEWDTSNVSSMYEMFNQAISFNGDITNWNTSNVSFMTGMFYKAKTFNQDISGWDVYKVERMGQMFKEADLFNQDLSSWNISYSLGITEEMFFKALSYDNGGNPEGLESWNVNVSCNKTDMFEYSKITYLDYPSWY